MRIIESLILLVGNGNTTHVYHGFGWPNLLCFAFGAYSIYTGISEKEFRARGGEPISTFKGKLLSFIIGGFAILLGIFGRNWHY